MREEWITVPQQNNDVSNASGEHAPATRECRTFTDRRGAILTCRAARSRKVLALLTCGLVLGIGASSTLAAWTDDEYASASVTAGTFGIEGAANGSTSYTDHTSSGVAMTIATTTGMYPGSGTTTSFLNIRLKSGSVAGSVSLASFTGAGSALGAALIGRVAKLGSATDTCGDTAMNALAAGAFFVGSASGQAALSGMKTGGTSPVFTLNTTTPEIRICVQYSLPSSVTDNALQGASTTLVWQFTGTT